MSFVVIVEPEEANAERIRAILETADRDFDYELVNSPEKAIDIVENRTVDVFISAMEMPVMSGTELFSMVHMMSPDTVRVAMTDASKMTDTVAFMNECKSFKVIIKPCRVADDLLSPISASVKYKTLRERIRKEEEDASMGMASIEQMFQEQEDKWHEALETYYRIQRILSQMLHANVKLANKSEEITAKLCTWYDWLLETYVRDVIAAIADFSEGKKKLLEIYHLPEQQKTMQIVTKFNEKVDAETAKEMLFILHVVAQACTKMVCKYDLKALLEETEKAYIIRISGNIPKLAGEDEALLYIEEDETVRMEFQNAVGKSISALGNKAVSLKKEDEIIVNIAIRR